jgi:hypothetical protein
MKLNYLLGLALALPLSASAVDMAWSGFGTLGAAGSDQPYKYQRFIDNQGTFKRDSILGAQLDIKVNSQWGATLQAKLAPASNSDSQWEPTLTWAFVSWRPLDDWLIRVGKLRLPLMLNTENTDVGATFDLARLPVEVYSIAPTTDVVGISISKTWLAEHYDWTLEAYSGKAKIHTRYYGREIGDPNNFPGSFFPGLDMTSSGLVLTVRDIGNTFRIGIHEAVASRPGEGTHADIPFTQIAPGIGFYDLNASRKVDKVRIPVQTFGASVLLPAEVRLTAEYARIIVDSSSEGFTRWGAYLAASRRFGDWTPYAYYARMKSPDHVLEKYKAINGSSVPGFIPNAILINQAQKLAADILSPYDQWTAALGTSYRLNANGLIKAEWSHTRSGVVSSFIDAPPGGDSANQRINVFSLSYNFTF